MANTYWGKMLYEEPMATQGLRTTGNDPLNQIASWYQFGQNWRKGIDARRAEKNRQRLIEAEANKYGNSNPQNGAIGADANGVYGMPMQPSVGVGADANGVYGAGQPTGGQFGNFTGQIPDSPYPVNNNTMPTQSDFGKALGNTEGGSSLGNILTTSGLDLLFGKQGGNTLGSLFSGGSLSNFSNPTSLANEAQVAGGATTLSADNPYARSSRYLGADYDRMAYVKQALDSGVKNPMVALDVYDNLISPLREEARKDRLRRLFELSSDPNADPKEREQARISLAGEMNNPDLLNELEHKNWQRQKEKDEWDINRIGKQIQIKTAEQAIEDKKNNKQVQLNAQKLSALFGDGKIYEMPLNETMEDTGLQKTDKEVVSGLNLLNTYSRKFFNTDLSANGGWRSEEHQKRLYKEQGKEPFMGSLHLKGRAVDIDVSKLSDAQREELMGFAEKLGFSTTYHDIGNGIHLHVELGDGRHLTDASVLMSNAGLKPSKENKNTKQTGSKYDSQTLADMINSTYPEGKTRATDAERGEIGNYMAGIVPLVSSSQDNWAQTAEKVYNYYQNTVGAGKGWTLNSEEFSNLVGRAVHKYFLDTTGVDIPVNTISGYVFAKFDPESQKRLAEAKKAEEQNKGKPKTIEEEAKQVLGVNSKSEIDNQKSEEQKPRVGSKLANDLNQPITFNTIMSGTKGVADRLRVNPNQYTDPNLTWHW